VCVFVHLCFLSLSRSYVSFCEATELDANWISETEQSTNVTLSRMDQRLQEESSNNANRPDIIPLLLEMGDYHVQRGDTTSAEKCECTPSLCSSSRVYHLVARFLLNPLGSLHTLLVVDLVLLPLTLFLCSLFIYLLLVVFRPHVHAFSLLSFSLLSSSPLLFSSLLFSPLSTSRRLFANKAV
jgi:hypothetical protein